jgi:thermitase
MMIAKLFTRLSNNLTRSSKALALFACTAACGFSAPLTAGEYIVKLRTSSDVNSYAPTKGATPAFISFENMVVADVHAPGGLLKVESGKATPAEEARQLKELMSRPDVEYVVKNFSLSMLSTPNDPKFAEQWALPKVRAPEAWDINIGSRSVVVAVIDTGVNYVHPDLAENIWTNTNEIPGNGRDDDGNGQVDDVHGFDFLDNDGDPNDATSQQNPGHGTHCSGIIGAVGNNGQGISGIAQQVAIMPLRFIGPNGQGDLMAAIKAIDYAIANHADVISASWGAQVSESQAQPLIEAIGRASDAGLIFVAAAANNGANNDSTPMYPANANFPNLIAIAASDSNDAKPEWSNYGKAKVHLSSPGLNIMSTLPGNTFGNLSGTSMATPLVAGTVALLKAESQARGQMALTGPQMRSLLQATGAQVAIETACMCRIDVAAAIEAIGSNRLIAVPTAATLAPGASLQMAAFGGSGGYTYTSTNPAVIEVTAAGALTAKALGETTVKVSDSAGTTTDTLTLRVADIPTGGGGEECPLGDPDLCALMCLLDPTLPWCS